MNPGITYTTFASNARYAIAIDVAGVFKVFDSTNNFSPCSTHLEFPPRISTLAWLATHEGEYLGLGAERINSRTGRAEGGTMSSMMQTPSIVSHRGAISYGFYDAPACLCSPLTQDDQLYVYVTEDYSCWMGNLAREFPETLRYAFHQFALPGAHDAGTFSLQTVKKLTFDFPFVSRAVKNLAVTQKDDITTMLNLGIRYFDFRPGTLVPPLGWICSNVRFHQHAFIPGYPYIAFLEDILTWLAAHPSEIVVVNANTQGFSCSSMKPTPEDLDNDLGIAFSNTGLTKQIRIGSKESLGESVEQLLGHGTRLIFLNQISNRPETTKYDSYCETCYDTLTPGPILKALKRMTAAEQKKADYTVLQMQGTATGVRGVVLSSLLTRGNTSSPLMSTKASFDAVINPWLIKHVPKNLSSDQLVIFLNDFADNAMVSTAIEVTKKRMGLQ